MQSDPCRRLSPEFCLSLVTCHLSLFFERPVSSLGQRQGEQRGHEETEGADPESGTESAPRGYRADGERRTGAEGAPEVISQSHGRGAERGGEQLGGDNAEAGEVSGAEEGEKRTEREKRLRRAGSRVERRQSRGEQEVSHVGCFPA